MASRGESESRMADWLRQKEIMLAHMDQPSELLLSVFRSDVAEVQRLLAHKADPSFYGGKNSN